CVREQIMNVRIASQTLRELSHLPQRLGGSFGADTARVPLQVGEKKLLARAAVQVEAAIERFRQALLLLALVHCERHTTASSHCFGDSFAQWKDGGIAAVNSHHLVGLNVGNMGLQ